MATYSDLQLLYLLANDPQAGIPALLDTYGAMINGIVNRILYQSLQDAEECVSDVLLAAWQNARPLLERKRPLKGWLCVTARNKAINRWHNIRRKQPDKEIFIRRYYLLESSREIGQSLGMEENAVNVRLSRGRAKLKQQFLQLSKEEYAHA